MSKGKKFDAAEKHFKEKEIKLKRDVNVYKEVAEESRAEVKKLTSEIEELKKENNLLKSKLEVLEKCTKLSDDEIQDLLSAERRNASLEGMLKLMNNHSSLGVFGDIFR